MVLEKLIEDAIIRKIKGVVPESTRVVGSWNAAADAVKDAGDASAVAIAVVVSPRAYVSFEASQADFACSIALTVRRDACPTGQELIDMSEMLFALMHNWNADEDAVFADLSVEGFLPAGLALTGGTPPQYDESSQAWSVVQTFTVRGAIS